MVKYTKGKLRLCPECKPRGCGKEINEFMSWFMNHKCGEYCYSCKEIILCPECMKGGNNQKS